MKKTEVKFGPIEEKMTEVDVEGQACETTYDCLHDCSREAWSGNSSSYTKGCYIRTWKDAHWSACN